MTFDLGIWPLTAWTYDGSHVMSINQVWFQLRLQLFKWGHFHILSLSYNLTSDDLWPWYVTFDLINKCGFPCCIYDPALFEIHQNMRKLESNVNPFSQHNRQQQWTKWSLCLSCQGRQHKNADQNFDASNAQRVNALDKHQNRNESELFC